ncbi:MAG: glycosyltransferase [Bacteroidia bacterium]|nr:glycosyltransferase [Bacteroidia bacterium]MCF8447396.1 glycosyltransferase [Bacteroidia bacterium]
MKNRDILVVGLQPYDSLIGSNCINIAEEFALNNRVLYVNYAFDRASIKREKDLPNVKKRIEMRVNKSENLIRVKNNLWTLYPDTLLESINWIPFTPLFRIANFINNKRFASEIKKAIKKLEFKDFILFNDSDMFRSFYLKEMLQPDCSIYYTRDNMMSVPYWRKHGLKLEAELMAKSDLVCANSTYLRDLASRDNKNSFYVGQGCDVSAFDKNKVSNIPSDIASIPKPIIGYIGALYTQRLDLEILKTIAHANENWSVVLIGPEDENFKKSELHQLKNVHFLGLKDGSVLPNYLAAFDVAINPQILNEVTIGNYPRKIDEYLAMGKPTVATGTKAMSIFSEHTYLAQNKSEYPALIEKALSENSKLKEEERITFAQSHTWENSVEAIYQAISTVKNK